ncbi:hypothetical protein ACFT5C_27495 [Streptomyces sp. NPDC057116]|uniref:hypothetical protein n=1 Tax=Streptomyces sp. NPDC057116 TaxID=3346023 RepID=UPI0036337FE7
MIAARASRSPARRWPPPCGRFTSVGGRMTWRTVKQFAEVATSEELFTGQWQNRPSVLDECKPYLDDRWNEGCTNAWKL